MSNSQSERSEPAIRSSFTTRGIDPYLRQTGLPSGVQQVFCVGSATPTPDWSTFLATDSLPNACADASGAGAAHIEVGVGGGFTSGTPFNVRFRVIDDLVNPTFVLMSDCVTVVVK